MVYAVQALLKFGGASARDQVQTDLTTFTAANAKWGIERIDARDHEGAPSLVVELRFEAQANQTALTNRLDQQLKGQKLPLAGSYVRWHNCPHDETPPTPCVNAGEQTW